MTNTLTIAQTEAAWLVIASLCDGNHVAITVMDTRACDPHASAEPDGEHEVVLYGADWRDLVAPAALQMRDRTGHPIRYQCCGVHVPRTTFGKRTSEEEQIYDELFRLIAPLER